MIDFKQSKIYGLSAYDAKPDEVIIRYSVCKLLSKRFADLKSRYKKGDFNFPLFEKYGVENCYIFLIEDYPCTSLDRVKTRIIYWELKLRKDPISFRKEIDNVRLVENKEIELEECKECKGKYKKGEYKRHLISKFHKNEKKLFLDSNVKETSLSNKTDSNGQTTIGSKG